MEILPHLLPRYSTKISDSCLIQLCWHSPKPYYLQVTLLSVALQPENPKPCPSSFSSQLLCKHLPYISFIMLITNVCARFLNCCQSHLQGNSRQAGTGTRSFLLAWSFFSDFSLRSLIRRILSWIFRNTFCSESRCVSIWYKYTQWKTIAHLNYRCHHFRRTQPTLW